jgi:hypothetical protein
MVLGAEDAQTPLSFALGRRPRTRDGGTRDGFDQHNRYRGWCRHVLAYDRDVTDAQDRSAAVHEEVR